MSLKKMEELKKDYEKIEMTKDQVEKMKKSIENAKKVKIKKDRRPAIWKISATAAAAAALILLPNISREAAYAMGRIPVLGRFVEVLTFRNYIYEDARHSADISVPELAAKQTETGSETADPAKETIKKTTAEINAEIQKITEQLIAEFKEGVKDKEGYQDIIVKHETLASNENYFTLKLICYQGAGSGSQWNYFYTIDLKTGKRLALKDLFAEGADYITPISDSIKKQMKEQMEADENVYYWLEEEVPEMNFDKITDETSFYLDKDENIVICFNEGDAAPMYMGCVEFVIDSQEVKEIRK